MCQLKCSDWPYCLNSLEASEISLMEILWTKEVWTWTVSKKENITGTSVKVPPLPSWPLRTSWKDGEQVWLTFTKSAVCLPSSARSLGFRVLGEAQTWNSSPYTPTFSDSSSVWLLPVRWLPDFLLLSRCWFPKRAIRNRVGDSLEILWGKIIWIPVHGEDFHLLSLFCVTPIKSSSTETSSWSSHIIWGYFLKALLLMTNLRSAQLVIDNALGFSESELIMERGSLGVFRVTITEFHRILLLYYFSTVFTFPFYSRWFRSLKWLERAVTTLIVQVGPGWHSSGAFPCLNPLWFMHCSISWF